MKEQRKIVLGGETVSYTLERKAVKNINLRLRPDTGLSVSAPKYVALSQVERVLMQHQQKIDRWNMQCDTVSVVPFYLPQTDRRRDCLHDRIFAVVFLPVCWCGKSCL